MQQQLNWTDFKSLCITEKSLRTQYIDKGTWYYIYTEDNSVVYWLEISQTDPRNADQIDFEDNYKSSCNQPIVSEISDVDTSNHKAVNGETVVDMDTINGLTPASGWIETSYVEEDAQVLITDASMSADTDGTFRFCIMGNGVKYIYYRAKDYIPICRNLPYVIPSGVRMSIEFLSAAPSGTTTSVSTCIGGIING